MRGIVVIKTGRTVQKKNRTFICQIALSRRLV